MSATRNIAAAYHKLEQIRARSRTASSPTCVILDADPLQDIENVRRISTVMKDGQIVDRQRLPLKKVLTAARDRHTSEY